MPFPKVNNSPRILGMRTDVQELDAAHSHVMAMTGGDSACYICAANVHMCMEAYDDPAFREVVNNADLVVPDGRPLVWAQRLLGHRGAQQVRGMDLMLDLCEQSARDGTPIGFYGASPDLLEILIEKLTQCYPGLNVVCRIAPPFRELTADEDNQYIDQINQSGARILFVGLGCPKQERWMAAHKDRLHCVMLGVGAAFDFLAGHKRHAPRWMQRVGLEWLFRLCSEPGRLWRRYLIQNPRFVWHFTRQWLAYKSGPGCKDSDE
jgi:N-acetylglucosaminyldiphosphoundecaprenol N-acetyl-beta-D-mannosaminyltransferase